MCFQGTCRGVPDASVPDAGSIHYEIWYNISQIRDATGFSDYGGDLYALNNLDVSKHDELY